MSDQTPLVSGDPRPRERLEANSTYFWRCVAVFQAVGVRVVVPILLLVIWEISSRTGIVDSQFVPPPSQVAQTLWVWIFGSSHPQHPLYSGNWLEHASSSGRRVLIGFVIASAAAVPVGVLIGRYKIISNLFDPLIQITRPIPVTAWIPFVVVFFGIREPSSIALIALGTFYPVVLNAAAGARQTPRVLTRAALMLGVNEIGLLIKVVLPSALPSIVTGLRLGIGLAWVLVIVSEMLAVKSGLGYALWDAYYYLNMDVIIAAMISVGFLGFISDKIILLIASHYLKWSQGVYGGR